MADILQYSLLLRETKEVKAENKPLIYQINYIWFPLKNTFRIVLENEKVSCLIFFKLVWN